MDTTPSGQLRSFQVPTANKYEPQPDKEEFVIVTPPPAITGTLRTVAIKDTILRWNRMSGKDTHHADIDGEKLIHEHAAHCGGADQLRFALLAKSNLDIQQLVTARQFCNKIRQTVRFALFHVNEKRFHKLDDLDQLAAPSSLADTWILHRLHQTVQAVDVSFKNHRTGDVIVAIRSFWLTDLCNVYLELIKPILHMHSEEQAPFTTLAILCTCLGFGLRLLYPIMPFITEELFRRLPGAKGGSIVAVAVAKYPTPQMTQRFHITKLDATMHLLNQIAHSARSTRASLQLTKQRLAMYITCASDDLYQTVKDNAHTIALMSNAAEVRALHKQQHAPPPAGCLSSVLSPMIEIHLHLQGLVDDVGAEIVKMEKNHARIRTKIDKMQQLMAGEAYVEKVPAAIRTKNEQQLISDTSEAQQCQASIQRFHATLTPEQLIRYQQVKLDALATDRHKLFGSIQILHATLPSDADKRPKRTLIRIAAAERQLEELDEAIAKLQRPSSSSSRYSWRHKA